MGNENLDTNTYNNDIGLYITQSGEVTIDSPFRAGLLATLITAVDSGIVVWENGFGNPQVASFESGETKPLAAKKILSSATVDGALKSTTVVDLYWYTASAGVAS